MSKKYTFEQGLEIVKDIQKKQSKEDNCKEICKHCGGDVHIRNPKGFCDHLYYPENCEVCLNRKQSKECIFPCHSHDDDSNICSGSHTHAPLEPCQKPEKTSNLIITDDKRGIKQEQECKCEKHSLTCGFEKQYCCDNCPMIEIDYPSQKPVLEDAGKRTYEETLKTVKQIEKKLVKQEKQEWEEFMDNIMCYDYLDMPQKEYKFLKNKFLSTIRKALSNQKTESFQEGWIKRDIIAYKQKQSLREKIEGMTISKHVESKAAVNCYACDYNQALHDVLAILEDRE